MPATSARPLNQKAKIQQFPEEKEVWGALNHYDTYSRPTIGDSEWDELINAIPIQFEVRQTPADSPSLGALPGGATVVWQRAEVLGGGIYDYILGSDHKIYQMPAAGGTPVAISGANSFSAASDIANWQGQKIIFTDSAVNKTYSWDGTTFALEAALTGQPGTCIAVFSQRLWFSFNNTITYTQGGTYNSLGGDSGSFTIIDEDATQRIVAMFPFNGLFYVFGPNFIQVIGNLIVSGSPAQLTFSKTTIAAEIGTVTRWSIIGYGANIFFATSYGVFTMSGAVPQKLSTPFDGFIMSFDAANTTWSSGYCEVYETPLLCWQIQVSGEALGSMFCIIPTIANTFTGITSTTGGWFRHQDVGCKFITSEVVNNVPTVFGTDGTNFYTSMTNVNSEVTSQFNSKLWNLGSALVFKAVTKYALVLMSSSDCIGTVDFIDDSLSSKATINYDASVYYIWIDAQGSIYEWDDVPNGNPYQWVGGNPQYQPVQFNVDMQPTRLFGVNIAMTGIGNAIYRHEIEFEMTTADWGD